jgi:hypothetical protein
VFSAGDKNSVRVIGRNSELIWIVRRKCRTEVVSKGAIKEEPT